MSDSSLTPSFVRTITPYIIGALATRLGFDSQDQTLNLLVPPLIGSVYYVIARFLEVNVNDKWGYVLGFRKKPVYVSVPPTDQDVADVAEVMAPEETP